jgi:Tfp pilus tip-associated adhesin PilY1
MSPADAAAYITSVTFGVHDKMPTCAGKISQIDYYLSIDNGVTWVKQLNWDLVQTPTKGGTTVTSWTYAVPAETYRQNTLNFSELGLTGRQLIWKAEYISQDDTCQPETIGVDVSYVAAKNQVFSRSAPTSLGNVMYSASFETPATTWTDIELRGHMKSERIYDPVAPTAGYAIATNWDAGSVLTAATPSARNILFPDMTVTAVANELLATGNGVIKTFTGTLAHHPLVNTSLSVTDTVETFTDVHTSTMQGNFTGTGTINRYTGAYSITFNTAPGNAIPIKANYQYYTTSSTMKQLTVANTSYSTLALDSSSYTDSTGFHYTYDFNGSGTASTADGTLEADADWLIQWTRGYKDGSTATVKKEWLLAAIDHSAPAIVGAPGMPSFYFGTDVNQSYKDSYDLFRCNQRLRSSLAFVGARDGMLHAFYAGEYRPFWYTDSSNVELPSSYTCDSAHLAAFRTATNHYTKLDATNNKIPYYKTSTGVEFNISRGYYDWKSRGGSSQTSPNYGDGSESFAIIPVDQLSKLKNNKLKGEDRAFVDASPSVAYVQFADSTWRAVLISAEGNGGDHVFGIDVTDPTTPKFLWEFADPDLYRSRSSPSVGIIGRINTTTGPKWVVFFVSGINKDATSNPSVYAIDVETGNVIRRVYLDTAGTSGLGGTPSGQPAVIDSDGNGYVDRMYIGTDKGFMYKATLPDNPTAAASDITVCTLYNAGQPIYASPAVSLQNTTNADGTTAFNVVILFGTSDSPYYTDTTGAVFYFYAISDKNARGACSTGTQQWRFQLPAGAQVFASAFATAGRVYFGTTTSDTEDPCSPPVASAGASTGGIYAMDIKTGATVYSDTTVGNITSTPLVDDEHLYFKSANGTLQARGGNTFQNQVRQGGGGGVGISSWNELTQ